MDQAIRNKLRNVVTQCRKLLEQSVGETLQGQFGIYPSGKKGDVKVEDEARMSHLSEEDRACRKDLIDHLHHIQALGYKAQDALAQLVREIAFTHLNRLCAYKMMEAREVYVGGQKFREAVSRGVKSQGFLFYLADHPDDEQRYNSGQREVAYRHFLNWLGGALSEEIGVLFNPNDPANRLYPPQRVLDQILDLLNEGDIKPEETDLRKAWPKVWSQDETIGWVYQYFTPKELRDQARKESQAPRNSYELAFRNQFFTPRYVVEFLTDNTLGRIWYEMRQGKTTLTEECRYMVRRPNDVFLTEDQEPPTETGENREDLSQEEILKQPVYIPHRPKKDPRELKILDPACGSGHFLLYCFDLLLTIYEEAYTDIALGAALQKDYANLDDLRRDLPRLILAQNIHGIDIDVRCTQIAALALWLRCQRAYGEMGLKTNRPSISRSNIVCAEPMPGEEQMLNEFVAELHPRILGQLVSFAFDKMKLAGVAGSLLVIDEQLREAVAQAKRQWAEASKAEQLMLFETRERKPRQEMLFDLTDITDEEFWAEAETKVLGALSDYAAKPTNGGHLTRKLFAEDAAHGFSFLNVCMNKYAVILMNPPFGQPPPAAESHLRSNICDRTRDMAAHSVLREIRLLEEDGIVGVVSPRSLLFLQSNEAFREKAILGRCRLELAADLGLRVMDEAWVEAVPFTVSMNGRNSAIFVRLLDSSRKEDDLAVAVEHLRNGTRCPSVHMMDTQRFRQYPKQIVSYWLPSSYVGLFRQGECLASKFGTIRQGLATANDFRFLRVYPEVAAVSVGDTYLPFAKGGPYAPFFGLPELMVEWQHGGEAYWEDTSLKTGRPRSNIWMLAETIKSYFRNRGLTYTRRTNSAFAPRALPDECIFADKGESIFCDDSSDLSYVLGIMHSSPFQILVEGFVANADSVQSEGAARGYVGGIIKQLPLPVPSEPARQEVVDATERLMDIHSVKYLWDECLQLFVSPTGGFCMPVHDSLLDCFLELNAANLLAAHDALECSFRIEQSSRRIYGLVGSDLEAVEEMLGKHPEEYPCGAVEPGLLNLFTLTEDALLKDLRDREVAGRVFVNQSYHSSRKVEIISHLAARRGTGVAKQLIEEGCYCREDCQDFVGAVVSYSVGIVLGRWDVRTALKGWSRDQRESPFSKLGVCSPGMLQCKDGLPVTDTPTGYLLQIDWDGILVDDPEHQDDIIRRIRDVLEVIWKDRADAIEREACEILGVKRMRDYFRRPSSGGFWDDHVKRYSKSRRRAPIYWLLQSSKKNYALWLYYHRLDKDMLFKALVNYVEPKIRLEEGRLEPFRAQRQSVGASGSGVKKLEKDIDKQESLLSELRDFEEKLRRAADLHLEPDLNDGVVLNIAPLWELVPWKEAKKYWDELMKGQYEWSSIGKQLREKGMVK